MSSVAAERQYAVELLLFIGGFHFSDLVYVVSFDNLHHLIRCTLCAEYRSALGEYAGKILRLHYTAVIMDQTVETVGYADYLNVVLAEHGVAGFCRTSYSSVKSGAVASARQYTYSALCHLYIQPFLKDLSFSAISIIAYVLQKSRKYYSPDYADYTISVRYTPVYMPANSGSIVSLSSIIYINGRFRITCFSLIAHALSTISTRAAAPALVPFSFTSILVL